MKTTFLVVMILSILFNQGKAQMDGFKQSIDSLLSEWQKPEVPGVAIAIVQAGKSLYSQSYGLANIKKVSPIDSLTQFWVASVSKQFTAAGIYILAAENKINLQYSVRRYLPDLPLLFESISIDHLLHHTSGIRDGFVLTALSKKTEEYYTNENVFKYLQLQRELNFKPGTEFEYNNSGYVLLALIIEKVSKGLYPVFIKEKVFLPLGMLHTFVSGKYLSNEKIAEGYHSKDLNKPGTFEEGHFKGNTYGSTGVITTISDMVRWTKIFHYPEKFPNFKQVVSNLLTPGRLSNGNEIAYGGGLEKYVYKGRTVYEHFGADEGFKANIVFFPSSNLSIIGLSNSSTNYQLSKILYSIADLIFKNNKNQHLVLKPTDKVIFTASYYSKDRVPTFRIVKRYDGYTKIRDTPDGYEGVYYHISDNIIQTDDPIPVTYRLINPEKIILIDPYNNQSRNLKAIIPVSRTSDLNKFTGKYFSPELETSYEIKINNNRLVLEYAPQIQFDLFRLTDNDFMFDYSGSNYIQFSKDGFKFSREGCRKLAFKKE